MPKATSPPSSRWRSRITTWFTPGAAYPPGKNNGNIMFHLSLQWWNLNWLELTTCSFLIKNYMICIIALGLIIRLMFCLSNQWKQPTYQCRGVKSTLVLIRVSYSVGLPISRVYDLCSMWWRCNVVSIRAWGINLLKNDRQRDYKKIEAIERPSHY